MLSNQSIKIQIFDLSIAKSIVHQYDFIQQIVQSNWSFFYLNRFVNNNTNQHLFIIYSTIFSTIARIFYSLQFEKDFEIYAFANQINVFFLISFETIYRFVRLYHFVYFICSTIFFRNCTSIHLYHNSKYLTKTYAFVRQIDAFFFVSFKKFFNSFDFDFVSSSWKFLFSRFLSIVRFRFFFWNRYSHTKND